jgi:hypothetical protein
MVETLGVVLEKAPKTARMLLNGLTLGSYCLGSPWNQVICKILLEKYLLDADSPQPRVVNVLRLLYLVQSLCFLSQVSLHAWPRKTALEKLDVEVYQMSV